MILLFVYSLRIKGATKGAKAPPLAKSKLRKKIKFIGSFGSFLCLSDLKLRALADL